MNEYVAGDGCMCYARSEGDCACSADWTDPEVYKLRERIAELEKGLEIALPTLRSAAKQQWDGAYNASQICSSLLKEQSE